MDRVYCGAGDKCNDEVTSWLRRKHLEEVAFLLRHRQIRTALALHFGSSTASARPTSSAEEVAATGVPRWPWLPTPFDRYAVSERASPRVMRDWEHGLATCSGEFKGSG